MGEKISTKSKSTKHWSISILKQLRPKQYGLNFGISSPTKIVNHFSLFENFATNHKEYPVANKTFGESSSRMKKRSNRIFLKFENAHAITLSAKEKDLEF